MTKYFFKSDFQIKESGGVYDLYPFEIVFWTESPKRTYKCGWDGEKYTNCHVSADGALVVSFNKHDMGVGILKAEKTFSIPDTDYEDGIRKAVSVGYYDVRLTINHDDVITDESTGAAFNGSAICFGSGKVENDEMLNDIEADVVGTTLVLNV